MTVSEHVYTAVLAGTPDVPLKVHEDAGSVGFDVDRSPHVEGSLRLSAISEDLLEAIDTRQSPPPRVQITADATFPTGGQSRSFDLTVRGHSRDQESGEPILTLASDEALLEDFSPLVDDPTPLTFRDSLYGFVGYVLDLAIPGATITPDVDEPIPVLSASENLIRNPRGAVDATDYAATWSTGGISVNRFASGGPSDAPTFIRGFNGGSTTNGYLFYTDDAVSVKPSTTYTMSCWVRTTAAVSLDAWMLDATPTIVQVTTPLPIVSGGAWVRVVQRFTTSPTTSKLRPRIVYPGTMGAGTDVDWTGLRLSEYKEDPDDVAYFDGDTADTADYEYSFGSVAHASLSRREPLTDAAEPAALVFRAEQTAMEFLAPIVQRAGRRLVCDENRVWTLRSAAFVADGSTTIRYGVNLTSGSERVSRSDDIWCDACVVVYTWTDRAGVSHRRVESYALSASPTFVRRIEKRDTPYPGPGFAQYVVERAQGRGREVTAATVSDWNTKVEQLVSIRLDGSPIQTGTIQRLEFDLSNDEMTVTARTLELDEEAILLDDPDATWLTTDPDETVGGP